MDLRRRWKWTVVGVLLMCGSAFAAQGKGEVTAPGPGRRPPIRPACPCLSIDLTRRLMVEDVVAVPDPQGRFTLDYSLRLPQRILALWISSDGDDTGSSFTLVLDKLKLGVSHGP